MLLFSILRTILGILYFLFGINGFFQFLPSIDFPGVKAEYLYIAFKESNYILPMIYVTAIISGTSFLLNLFSAFFLLLFFPITINFSLFYYYLGAQQIFSPEMFIPLVVNFIHIVLLFSYYNKYRELLKPY